MIKLSMPAMCGLFFFKNTVSITTLFVAVKTYFDDKSK